MDSSVLRLLVRSVVVGYGLVWVGKEDILGYDEIQKRNGNVFF